jgi:signal transduction histidine kinase
VADRCGAAGTSPGRLPWATHCAAMEFLTRTSPLMPAEFPFSHHARPPEPEAGADGAAESCRILAAMGHDLRTPLNSIIGFTGTLLMQLPGPLTADQEKHLKIVQSSGRHLLQLIDVLVDLAKIDSGKLAVRTEPVDCAGVAEQVAAGLRPRAEAKGLSFTLENRLAQHRMLDSDPVALARILTALAENAVQYTGQGGVRIVIEETPGGDAGHPVIEFRVHDTGPGIPAAEQASVFDVLARIAAGPGKHRQGAGLGLHLSARLARLLGGRIHLHSEPGRGSTFTLLLPEASP